MEYRPGDRFLFKPSYQTELNGKLLTIHKIDDYDTRGIYVIFDGDILKSWVFKNSLRPIHQKVMDFSSGI